EGIAIVLKEDGLAVIEVPYVVELVNKCEFDTIYHEHLCYFSVTALDHLFRRNGLAVAGVEHISIHGGSLRLFVGHSKSVRPSDEVSRILAEEAACGIDRCDFYLGFARCVETVRSRLCG